MGNKAYTQRDFAALAGISTATVVNMVKNRELSKTPEGRIPQIEIRNIILKRIAKYASKGSIVLTLNEDLDTQAKALDKFLQEQVNLSNKSLKFFGSIDDIVNSLTMSNHNSEIKGKYFAVSAYNKKVINTFIDSYKTIVNNLFIDTVSNAKYNNLSNLPASTLYNLMLYDKVDDYDEAIGTYEKDVNNIQIEIHSLFDNLMRKLYLVNPKNDKELLFNRSDIDADFLNKSFNSELYKLLVIGTENKGVVELKNCPSIAKDINLSIQGKILKTGIDDLLRNGYYTTFNYNDNVGELLSLVTSGAFGHIYVYNEVGNHQGLKELDEVLPIINNLCKIHLIEKEGD
jgi:hypothetical protein